MSEVKWKHAVLPAELIDVPKGRSRKRFGDLKELGASFGKAGGMINPVTVQAADGGRYTLLAGERRLRAWTKYVSSEVPCRIAAGPVDPLEIEEQENEQRLAFTILERYHMAQRKVESLGDGRTDHNDDQRAEGRRRDLAAAEHGMSGATFSRVGKVVEKGTKELQKLLEDEELPVRAAAEVADLPAEQQKKYVEGRKSGRSHKTALNAASGKADGDWDEAPDHDEPRRKDKDGLGKSVPKHLRDIFNTAVFADCGQAVRIVIKQLHAARKWNPWLALEDAQTYLKLASDIAVSAQPYAVCPGCKGAEQGCKHCRGSGWLTENAYLNYEAEHG